MRQDNNELLLKSDDFWSVKDLFIFLSSLNCLYNRLFVLKRYKKGKLYNKFRYSTLQVLKDEQINIKSLKISSPAEFNLRGIGEIIGQLREVIKDLSFRNWQEQTLGNLEIIIKTAAALRQIGFSEREIKERLLPQILNPIKKINGKIKKHNIELVEDKTSEKNKDKD